MLSHSNQECIPQLLSPYQLCTGPQIHWEKKQKQKKNNCSIIRVQDLKAEFEHVLF